MGLVTQGGISDTNTQLVKIGILDETNNIIIEPMYFCIRSNRTTGKVIYLEQTLSKPCVNSYTDQSSFIYDVNPKYLAAIRKLISNTQYLTSDLKEMLQRANNFYFLNCYPVEILD
jgi:hypothetical protein